MTTEKGKGLKAASGVVALVVVAITIVLCGFIFCIACFLNRQRAAQEEKIGEEDWGPIIEVGREHTLGAVTINPDGDLHASKGVVPRKDNMEERNGMTNIRCETMFGCVDYNKVFLLRASTHARACCRRERG